MRITIVTGPFHSIPPAPAGAVERLWTELAEQFAARGHKVRLVCRSHPDLGPARKRGTSMPLNLAKDLAYATRALLALPRADILVTNTFFLPVLAWLRPAAGRVCVNVQRVPKNQMCMYRRCGVARFHAVSTAIRDAIIAECPQAEPRIRVIPNPIRIDVFRPRASVPSGPPTVLYTGRIHPEKGLDLLVTACRSLLTDFPDLRLRLVGAIDPESGGGGQPLRRQLLDLAGPLSLDIVPPIYDREALRAEICAATLYAYPSVAERGESFGVAPLEAMACGHAPIVSSLACFRDFLHDQQDGLVFDHRAPDAADHLAAALRRQLTNPAEHQAMAQTAATTAQQFSVEAIADRYLADFEALLD
jgi:glycosyltransferase involved in cell wall biosynthesis